jgi:hypothetical protein
MQLDDAPPKSALAGAAFPDKPKGLSALDREGDVVDGVHIRSIAPPDAARVHGEIFLHV